MRTQKINVCFVRLSYEVINKHSHNVQQIKREQKSQRGDYRAGTVPSDTAGAGTHLCEQRACVPVTCGFVRGFPARGINNRQNRVCLTALPASPAGLSVSGPEGAVVTLPWF